MGASSRATVVAGMVNKKVGGEFIRGNSCIPRLDINEDPAIVFRPLAGNADTLHNPHAVRLTDSPAYGADLFEMKACISECRRHAAHQLSTEPVVARSLGSSVSVIERSSPLANCRMLPD
jgi:hypothetical protein